MARARRAAPAKPNDPATSNGALTCPECGKSFTRPASLGAHRNRAHGVTGSSNRAQRIRTRKGARNDGTSRRGSGAKTTRRPTTRRHSNTSASGGDETGGINRDALLQALFPNGLPAREAVIQRANAWLDEAEQLARTR
jgi:uncharacterized C2H2 Zn-finger protein